MELIGLFVLVLISATVITLTYLRFMIYMEKHHPSYIGAGLRNRLFSKYAKSKIEEVK